MAMIAAKRFVVAWSVLGVWNLGIAAVHGFQGELALTIAYVILALCLFGIAYMYWYIHRTKV